MTDLSANRVDPTELGGGKRHGRSAQKAAAVEGFVNFRRAHR
jgi:hypothetical protein